MKRLRMATIKVETWTKSFTTKYSGAGKATLVITPQRKGYKLVSSAKFAKGDNPKPDIFFETNEQVEKRRDALEADGFRLSVKKVKVPAEDAPQGLTDAEVAERQYREELGEMLRAIKPGKGRET